jgi:hypothetical protein
MVGGTVGRRDEQTMVGGRTYPGNSQACGMRKSRDFIGKYNDAAALNISIPGFSFQRPAA